MRFGQRCKIPSHLRCEALLLDSYMRPTNNRCGHFASIAIDGTELCGKHASIRALDLALKKGTAKNLPKAPWPQRRRLRLVDQDEV